MKSESWGERERIDVEMKGRYNGIKREGVKKEWKYERLKRKIVQRRRGKWNTAKGFGGYQEQKKWKNRGRRIRKNGFLYE